MGRKTSIYLTDDLDAAFCASPDSLAAIVRRGLTIKPRLVEEPTDERTWVTRWYCDVPPVGSRFKVLSDAWHNLTPETGPPVPCREIYEVEATQQP